MKKILFFTNNMNIGGIQKALLELLKVLSKREDYAVSLFCANRSGILLEQIPKNITILPENKWAKVSETALHSCKKMGLCFYLFRVLASVWTKLFHKGLPARLLCALVGNLGTYDMAISYAQPIQDKDFCNLTNEFALHCCKAKRKAVFIHCDFANYGGNSKRNRKLLQKFDAVAAVSDSVGQRLIDCVPELASKVCTVPNCHDFEAIRAMADIDPVTYTSGVTFVTVARLSEEKGLLLCIPIFAKLHNEGYDVHWHIVGGGSLQSRLEESIANYGAGDYIVLEGEQINPYRFIRNADFFLLPSFHEAAPVVFGEAAALGTEVISTRTLSAEELVASKGIGVVCDNTDEGIAEAIEQAVLRRQACESRTAVGVSNQEAETSFIRLCEERQ